MVKCNPAPRRRAVTRARRVTFGAGRGDETPPPGTIGAVNGSPSRRLRAVAALFAALGAGTAPAVGAEFHTPSGNIRCVLSGGGASASVQCWVLSRACRGEGGTFAYSWAMRATRRPVRFCPGDIVAAGRVLRYGRSVRAGVITCTSRVPGLTCTNRRTGHGFFLSRERQRVF